MADDCCSACDELGAVSGIQGPAGPAGASGATGPAGATGISTLFLGVTNIFVSKAGNDATGTNSDLTKSFLTIGAAITKASTLVPSSSNMINIIVYPGEYTESFSIPSFVTLTGAVDQALIYQGTDIGSMNTSTSVYKVYVNGTITIATSAVFVSIKNVSCVTLANNTTNVVFVNTMMATTSITSTVGSQGFYYDVHSPLFLSGVTYKGYFEKCTFGNYSLGGVQNGTAFATLQSTFIDCYMDSYCLSSSQNGAANTVAVGTIIRDVRCANYCIASSQASTGSTCNANIYNLEVTGVGCVSHGTTGGSVSTITIKNSILKNTSGIFSGCLIDNCRISHSTAAAVALNLVGSTNKIRKCDIKGGAGGYSIAAAAPINGCITHTNLYGGGTNNITNLVATPYNTDDINDIF